MQVIKVEVQLTQEAPSDAQTVNFQLYSYAAGIGWTSEDTAENEDIADVETSLENALLATFPDNEPA